jgi:hypothetical protein
MFKNKGFSIVKEKKNSNWKIRSWKIL